MIQKHCYNFNLITNSFLSLCRNFYGTNTSNDINNSSFNIVSKALAEPTWVTNNTVIGHVALNAIDSLPYMRLPLDGNETKLLVDSGSRLRLI